MTLASRDVQKNCSRMRVWTFNGTSAAAIIYWQIREIDMVLRHWGPDEDGLDTSLLPT